jgi:NhaA family Na+:H+ antiporter
LRPLVQPLQRFVGEEASSGVLLLAAAITALIWVNLPGAGYEDVWTRSAHLDFWQVELHLDVRHWINDGLMSLFFFVVALEIKREVVSGQLSDRRRATLPVVAAAGGMIVPAALYAVVNAGDDSVRGWGIPMATDIAFALGLLSLFGPRIPNALRAFLLALAIVDDIGGIAVIAVFYSGGLSATWLGVSALTFGGAAVLAMFRVRALALYALLGVFGWFAVHESGVHATIAGVLLGLVLPVHYHSATPGVIDRVEDIVHPWSSYLVIPLFALANAGVELGGGAIREAVDSRVALGVIAGLLAGKPLGIVLFSAIAVRAGFAALPEGSRWQHIAGLGFVAGIGFTVAIFISTLAFDDPRVVAEAKIGILVASIASAALGAMWLGVVSTERSEQRPGPA